VGSPLQAGTGAAVHISEIQKTFLSARGAIHALAETSLAIRQGEFVSIVGPSGCGKSTLLSLIAGLDAPTAGKILIEGQEVRGPHDSLGVVFQRDLLLDWRTVMDNVLLQIEMRGLAPKAHAATARQLLDPPLPSAIPASKAQSGGETANRTTRPATVESLGARPHRPVSCGHYSPSSSKI
jgi:NitT/TauT family transport system ATP-binding protein